MADIRINALPTTASASSSDDYIALDGTTNGTRKLNAYSPTFGGNLTVSGTGGFGGSTGPHTFGNGGGAVEVRAVGDSSGYYGYALYTGGSYESSLKHSASTAITKLDVGRNSAWGGAFEIYADTTRAARFAKTSTTLDGNLTVSGTGTSSVGGSFGIGTTAPTTINGVAYAFQQVANVTGSGTCALNITGTQAILSLVDSNASANVKWLTLTNSNGVSTLGVLNDAGSTTQTGFQFFHSTGNFLFGTGNDSGNGKIQLATHTTSAGGIGFGTDTSLYRSAAGFLQVDSLSGNNPAIKLAQAGVAKVWMEYYAPDSRGYITTADSLAIRTNGGTTALTLDSSQNATFAGNYVYVGGGTSFYLRATGSGNGIWYGNIVSFDGNSFSLRNQAGTVTNHSFDSSKVFIANTQAVPATPTGGGHLYVEGGALKYKGSSGTVTTIANA